VDDEGREVPWESWQSGNVRGTAITVTKALLGNGQQEKPADG
jgi:hypothetical protein